MGNQMALQHIFMIANVEKQHSSFIYLKSHVHTYYFNQLYELRMTKDPIFTHNCMTRLTNYELHNRNLMFTTTIILNNEHCKSKT